MTSTERFNLDFFQMEGYVEPKIAWYGDKGIRHITTRATGPTILAEISLFPVGKDSDSYAGYLIRILNPVVGEIAQNQFLFSRYLPVSFMTWGEWRHEEQPTKAQTDAMAKEMFGYMSSFYVWS